MLISLNDSSFKTLKFENCAATTKIGKTVEGFMPRDIKQTSIQTINDINNQFFGMYFVT